MIATKLINFALLLSQAAEKGVLLFMATVLAILVANSEFAAVYHNILGQHLGITFAQYTFQLTVHEWINDLLMAIFFLMVGMEIKRELVTGHLSNRSQRCLPFFAAIGGVLFPILIYCLFNYNHSNTIKGWAIPAATDIAFALGALALFGKGLHSSLRVFLTALAIIDDLIAVIIITIFYTDNISFVHLLYISICIVMLVVMNRYNFKSLFLYLAIGGAMWYCFFQSGVHATIAGVIVGLAIPISNHKASRFPLINFDKLLSLLVTYFILPIFAFANSGIILSNISFDNLLNRVTLGVAMGLFIGKQLGIFTTIYLLIKCRIVTIPPKVTLCQFYGVSVLCGIGFTMSLFVGILSFNVNNEYLEAAKAGVLLGSLMSFILGAVFLKIYKSVV